MAEDIKPTCTAPSSDTDALASPQPGTKRKKVSRTALTVREKAIVKSFCEQKVTDCKARGELVPSQEVLRREVATQFGWSCGRSTLSKIISMDWKLLRSSHEGGEAPRNPNMKRRRRPLFPAFEADLVKFIFAHVGEEGGTKSTSEQSPSVEIACGGNTTSVAEDKGTQSSEVGDSRRRPLTEALILEEAQRLKQVHGVSDEMLMLSVGWLARFKHRHCIRLRKPAGVANKCRIPQHQQDVSAEPVLMGAWSAGLMSASLSQPQVLIGESLPHQHTADSCVGDTGDLLPSSSQQGVNLELASGSEGTMAPTKTALCSAQWYHGEPTNRALLEQIPQSIRELACTCQKYDDCIGAIGGLKVAVVGFGSVVDAFLLAEAVGADGSVVCVEASASNIYTAEQIAESFCLSTQGLPAVNMKFIMGEYSGMPQSSSSIEGELKNLQGRVDLVICNCSIQSLEFPASKNAVLELAFSLLKVGGELRVTDLVCSRRLSSSECEEARLAMTASDETTAISHGSSNQLQQKLLLGAPYVGDLKRLFRALGADVEVRTESCNEADAAAIDGAVASLLPPLASASNVQFRRVTFHAFRIQDVEEPLEDYGQTAIFNGSDVGGKAVVDNLDATILFTATSAPGSTLDSSEDARIADQSTLAISPPSPEPLEIANI
ncbi:hypothetical protein PC129_g10006 [Phytophthora cactorum]|uniref:HTH CENPB-type domain-containing protein n=1 Tax=Phytophthora cactorum TaxID=29920 RepID=A0A8T1I212_9STRA|nr:hypothetical protein PC111_g10548 [Phytophthora cactorum]KAG2857460.1 hypothetical protein PC113_g10672 [Phytophthora cactorum]KAG2920417.1 hypothetical protein PC115_g9830 [Phytophthora cactorum]KAG2979605.1 hypothetical protein PC118_g11680 [Phytophthora cactorum]KAG3020539.1 hypothetical protein PC120_g9227 [Phytophthora cactorum]